MRIGINANRYKNKKLKEHTTRIVSLTFSVLYIIMTLTFDVF